MYWAYIDDAGESGHNLSEPEQPYFFCAAVLVHDKVRRQVGQEITEKVYEPNIKTQGFYFHAHKIFSGAKPFDDETEWPIEKRKKILENMAGILRKYELPIFYGAVNKPGLKESGYRVVYLPRRVGLIFCCQRMDKYVKRTSEDEWFPVIGRTHKIEQYKEVFEDRKRAERGIRLNTNWERLTETTMAVANPQVDRTWQLSDLAAWAISRNRRIGETWGIYGEIYTNIKSHMAPWPTLELQTKSGA